MRLQEKSLSKLTLDSLLRKKRSTLESFLKETGIVTYETLETRCRSIGVVPPEREQFLRAMGNPVVHEYSSPTEGIVVLNPLEDSKEITDVGNDVPNSEELSTNIKRKKKKVDSIL
jgi:hypothetical protein